MKKRCLASTLIAHMIDLPNSITRHERFDLGNLSYYVYLLLLSGFSEIGIAGSVVRYLLV